MDGNSGFEKKCKKIKYGIVYVFEHSTWFIFNRRILGY